MFEDFLIDHGVYADYMSEFEKHRTVSFGFFLNNTPQELLIKMAFEWDKTVKGAEFWIGIHDKWVS